MAQEPVTKLSKFIRFLRDDCPENPRVIVLWAASAALILVLVAMARACSKWVLYHGDLGAGACWAFGTSVAGLMFLAGYAVGFPKAFIPGSTTTTSESISTPAMNRETSSTLIVDPSSSTIEKSSDEKKDGDA